MPRQSQYETGNTPIRTENWKRNEKSDKEKAELKDI